MVIISTSAVAAIIQAVSPASIFGAAARRRHFGECGCCERASSASGAKRSDDFHGRSPGYSFVMPGFGMHALHAWIHARP